MTPKEYMGIGVVLVVGAVLAFFISSSEPRRSSSDDHGHDHHGHSHGGSDHKGHDHKGSDCKDHDHEGHDHEKSSDKPKAATTHEHTAHADDPAKKHDHDSEAHSSGKKDTQGAPQGHKEEKHKEHGHDHDHADHDGPCDHDHRDDHKDTKTQPMVIAGGQSSAGVAFANVEPASPAHKHDAGEHDSRRGDEHQPQSAAGPHGGKILSEGDFRVEVTIYEKGRPPQFRVYCFDHDTPVDPAEVKLSMEVRRPGGIVNSFRFRPEAGYLFSDKDVDDPHSFTVSVTAEWHGKTYAWEYAQVDGHVELSEKAAQAAGIEIHSAGPQRVGSVFELPGEVSFNADMVAHVVPRVAGVISGSLKNLGDPVRKGELIAVIESREMAEAKSRYLVFLKREELARTVFERTENLWKKMVTPEQSYLNDKKALEEAKIETMAAAQKLMALGLSEEQIAALAQAPNGPLNRYELHAPFDGVVVKKHMAIGEWATENKDLLVLADLSSVWVEIIVYVKDLGKIRIGQKATVKSDASDQSATGVVSYVGPLVGEETRTARARVVLPNTDNRWRPGLFVTVKLAEDQVDVPVAVRKDAIQMLGDWSVVFVRDQDAFRPRPLQLGLGNGKYVEVVKGLSPGERYAGRNSFLLKSQLGIGGLSHSH